MWIFRQKAASLLPEAGKQSGGTETAVVRVVLTALPLAQLTL